MRGGEDVPARRALPMQRNVRHGYVMVRVGGSQRECPFWSGIQKRTGIVLYGTSSSRQAGCSYLTAQSCRSRSKRADLRPAVLCFAYSFPTYLGFQYNRSLVASHLHDSVRRNDQPRVFAPVCIWFGFHAGTRRDVVSKQEA